MNQIFEKILLQANSIRAAETFVNNIARRFSFNVRSHSIKSFWIVYVTEFHAKFDGYPLRMRQSHDKKNLLNASKSNE